MKILIDRVSHKIKPNKVIIRIIFITLFIIISLFYLYGNSIKDNKQKNEFENMNSVTFGTKYKNDFIVDNVYHSNIGDINFSSFIPKSYDGKEPYALFITLPGWEGLYFQGVGANLVEDFPFEARKYNEKMIIISTQLNDWGMTSAKEAIELTKYFINNYNIDRNKIYLHGFSGGGETGSLVMEIAPELYTKFLCCSSKWDGSFDKLLIFKTPVYLAIGENDSYYGSRYFKEAYENLKKQYQVTGLSDDEISKILILDVKNHKYFSDNGYEDEHGGGMLFANDQKIMKWLFN